MIPKKQQCATVLNLENKGIVILMQISEYRIFFFRKSSISIENSDKISHL